MSGSALQRLGPIQAVSFDFTGTLAHAPRLGEIYSEAFARHGVPVDAAEILSLFRETWQELDFRVELGADRFRDHPDGPKGFWRGVLDRILERLGEEPASPFLVEELFDRFRRAEAWELFPDVLPTLDALRASGRRLAVLSNFDHRLPDILAALGLAERFELVLTSWEVGAEKPHPLPFETLRSRLDVHPRRLAHVGNDRRRDVEGAEAVGIRALWLVRDEEDGEGEEGDLASLTELPTALRGIESAW